MKIGTYKYSSLPKLSIQVDKFDGGTNTIQRASRLKPNEASESLNLMLVDDGVWSPRWGSKVYGGAVTGASKIDGFSEYIKSDGTRELIVVGGGKVWRKNGDSWTEITGATFTAGTKCFFKQINAYLYITNGTDPLARYNGTSLSKYTELDAPTGVSASLGSGLATGTFNNYYVITALNSIGETTGSTAVLKTTNLKREVWTGTTNNQYISLTWNAVANATRYQIYYADESGYEVLLDSSQTNAYTDYNTATPNIYIEVPDANTTGGPVFSTMELSGNRLWGTKDTTNKYRVHFSGSGVNIGTFSDFYGGGWIDLEKGGRTFPEVCVDYRDGQGNSRTTVVCSTPEGTGTIWQIQLASVTVGSTSFTVPSASKVVGSFGTSSARSVQVVANDVYYFNKKGVFVLGNERQFWGILRTNELSVRIRPYIEAISAGMEGSVCSYYFDDKVFYSCSTNGSYNNRTFYYDRESMCWVADWSTGVIQFGEFTDSSGVTHFLGASDTDGYLVEFSEGTLGDRGVAFSTRYKSPQFSADKDWTKFGKIKKCYVRIAEPKGAVSISLSGTGRKTGFSAVATATITSETANTGLGFDLMGEVLMGSTDGTPTTFAQENTQRHLKIKNKKLRDIQLTVETSGLENGYTLLGYRVTGTLLVLNDPSSEKLSS